MTLSLELVTEWIDSFPVAVYLTDAMVQLYSEEKPNSSAQTKHKEEGDIEAATWLWLSTVDWCITGQTFLSTINQQWCKTLTMFKYLPSRPMSEMPYLLMRRWQIQYATAFHLDFMSKLSVKWRWWAAQARHEWWWLAVFGLEIISLRLLVVGQKRQLQLALIFKHRWDWLLTEGEIYQSSRIVKVAAPSPDITIVNMQQMLHHVLWSQCEYTSDHSEHIKRRLSC